jgi:lincosamide nucleotidyltransferase A/C/D/E
MMAAEDVLALLEGLSEAGIRVWLDGGWGVDALLGRQHRTHDDIDLVVGLAQVAELIKHVEGFGYAVVESVLPTRLVLQAPGAQIDLHPVTFDHAGNGWQSRASPDGSDCLYPADGFTVGHINGVEVSCLGPEVQLAHHSGYAPRQLDRDDMARLANAFDLQLTPPYSP